MMKLKLNFIEKLEDEIQCLIKLLKINSGPSLFRYLIDFSRDTISYNEFKDHNRCFYIACDGERTELSLKKYYAGLVQWRSKLISDGYDKGVLA